MKPLKDDRVDRFVAPVDHLTRLPRSIVFVLVLGAIAGTFAAVSAFRNTAHLDELRRADTRHAAESAAAAAAAAQHTGESLRYTQKCIVALLLLTPEQRSRLSAGELHRLCPPVRRFLLPTSTTTTTTHVRHRTRSTTKARHQTTTTRARSTTTSTTTTTTSPPCQTIPVAGRCIPRR